MSEALDIENYGIDDDDGMPNGGRVTGYLGYLGAAPHYSGIKIAPDMVKKVNEMCIRNAKRKRRKERIKRLIVEFFDFDKLFLPGLIAMIVVSIILAFILF